MHHKGLVLYERHVGRRCFAWVTSTPSGRGYFTTSERARRTALGSGGHALVGPSGGGDLGCASHSRMVLRLPGGNSGSVH